MGYRNYFFNEHYFTAVDTEEKAYWLGFITADGCVHVGTNYNVQVVVAVTDKDHLDKLRAALDYAGPMFTRETSRSVVLKVNSKILVQDLISLGVTPRKSLICEPWDGPKHLMRHYWRGVLDGDGSICTGLNRGKYPCWRVNLVGSEGIVRAFGAFIIENGGPRGTTRPYRAVWRAEYGGLAGPQSIVRMLYAAASVYLDRKYATATKVLSEDFGPVTACVRHLSLAEIDAAKASCGTWIATARHFGCSANGLRVHRKKLHGRLQGRAA